MLITSFRAQTTHVFHTLLMRLDSKKRICLTEKALRTVDHFLLFRYFDYQQVAFHKTVAALELVLKDVLQLLLDKNVIDCSPRTREKQTENGDWKFFDDALVLSRLRDMSESEALNPIEQIKVEAILRRTPPKLIIESEKIQRITDRRDFLGTAKGVEKQCDTWANQFGIDRNLWYIWQKSITLTKIGSRIPTSDLDINSQKNADKYEQSVRVLSKTNADSKPVFDLPYSLMSVLSEYELTALRVYVLLPEDKQNERENIAAKIKLDSPYANWKD